MNTDPEDKQSDETTHNGYGIGSFIGGELRGTTFLMMASWIPGALIVKGMDMDGALKNMLFVFLSCLINMGIVDYLGYRLVRGGLEMRAVNILAWVLAGEIATVIYFNRSLYISIF